MNQDDLETEETEEEPTETDYEALISWLKNNKEPRPLLKDYMD